MSQRGVLQTHIRAQRGGALWGAGSGSPCTRTAWTSWPHSLKWRPTSTDGTCFCLCLCLPSPTLPPKPFTYEPGCISGACVYAAWACPGAGCLCPGAGRRSYKGGELIPAESSLDYSANFSHMLGFDDPDFYELMRLYLTIHT